jgi:hypothetical protein
VKVKLPMIQPALCKNFWINVGKPALCWMVRAIWWICARCSVSRLMETFLHSTVPLGSWRFRLRRSPLEGPPQSGKAIKGLVCVGGEFAPQNLPGGLGMDDFLIFFRFFLAFIFDV